MPARELLELLLLERLSGHDVGAGEGEAVLLRADDGAFHDGGMAHQAMLDLGRSDPDPAHLDQVVRAAAVPEVAVGVALEEVTRANAVAVEGLLRLLVLAPVEERGGVPLDPELPILGDVRLVAGHELTGASRLGAAGAIRDVDVVRLGRADPVEHLDAEGIEPTVVELLWQRLAGRRTQAHRRHVECQTLVMSRLDSLGDHLRHHRRDIHKDRRLVLGDQLEDSLGRGALREDDPGGADPEREQRDKVSRVPEEELGDGEDDVVRPEIEDAARVPLEAEHRAVGGVDRSLRLPRRPCRELPERDVVFGRRSRLELRGGAREPVGKRPVHDEDLSEPAASFGRLPDRRLGRLVGDDDAGARVVEVVGVVLRLEKGVRLGGDRPDLLRAIPECDELDGVGEHEQHAFLGSDPELVEDVAAAVHELGQLRVRRRATGADQGVPTAATFFDVPVDEVRGEVELAREVVVIDHAAATSRISSTSISARVSNVRSPSSAVASAGAPAYAWSMPIATKLVFPDRIASGMSTMFASSVPIRAWSTRSRRSASTSEVSYRPACPAPARNSSVRRSAFACRVTSSSGRASSRSVQTCSGSRWLLTSTTRSSPEQISVTSERRVSSPIETPPGKSLP